MRKLLAVLAAAVLALTACGGDSEPSATSNGSGTEAEGKAAAGGSTEFCSAHSKNEALGDLAEQMSNPSAVRAALVEAEANLDAAVEAAPAEIKAEMKTFADAYRPFIREMVKADLDPSKVDVSVFTALQDPKVTTALQRIGDYYSRVCG